MKNRILLNKNSTLTDYSNELNNYHSNTSIIFLEKDTDYLYVGQPFPFNHLYFKINTANTTSAVFTIDVWDGTEWQSTVEVNDETNSFFNSGFITWVTDKNEGWACDDTVDESGAEEIDGFGTSNVIYDKYWIRIKTDTSNNGKFYPWFNERLIGTTFNRSIGNKKIEISSLRFTF